MWVFTRFLPPAVHCLFRLTLLDAVYAFLIAPAHFQWPPHATENCYLKSCATLPDLHQLRTITKITINRLLSRSRSEIPDCQSLPPSPYSPRLWINADVPVWSHSGNYSNKQIISIWIEAAYTNTALDVTLSC